MKHCDHTSGPGPVGRRVPGMTRVLVAMLGLVMCIGSSAHAADAGDTAEEVSLGIASVIVTIPYGASKVAYAGLGAVIGGGSPGC